MTEILPGRTVPLGGLRAMSVTRSLPQRTRSTIGPWCFVDAFGPDEVASTGGMRVGPHPHIGLQTVSWLVEGSIEHRDSLGSLARIDAGQMSLMTAGRGITHSERTPSADAPPTLHGVQMWLALPDAAREMEPAYRHHDDLPRLALSAAAQVTVVMGEHAGVSSPAATHWPTVAVEVHVTAAGITRIALDATYEHGILPFFPGSRIDGQTIEPGDLLYLPPGRAGVDLQAEAGSRFLIIGGAPFDEKIIMWWNFVGRTHDEVAAARADYAGLSEGAIGPSSRFSPVARDTDAWVPAPDMPHVRLIPRP